MLLTLGIVLYVFMGTLTAAALKVYEITQVEKHGSRSEIPVVAYIFFVLLWPLIIVGLAISGILSFSYSVLIMGMAKKIYRSMNNYKARKVEAKRFKEEEMTIVNDLNSRRR